MAYYSREHKKLKLSGMQYLNSGSNAKVLYNSDIIFKEYYSATEPNCRLSEKMFDILKNINDPHFIELFDIYSDFDFDELLKNKINILPFTVDAYTAKYYPADPINVLLEHKDYILDNFRELELLFGVFTKNMIRTHDIKSDNTVIGKNGIVIIDPDLFNIMKTTEEFLASLNQKELLNLFRSILGDSIEKDQYYREFMALIDNELVNIEVTENTNITYEISKKLKYVKKPIELFKR